MVAKESHSGRMPRMKTTQEFRRMERIVKGYANHRRLQILELLSKQPDLSIESIANHIKSGYENTSDHLRKMSSAGLLEKRNDGPNVLHRLSPRAEVILAFCKKLR